MVGSTEPEIRFPNSLAQKRSQGNNCPQKMTKGKAGEIKGYHIYKWDTGLSNAEYMKVTTS